MTIDPKTLKSGDKLKVSFTGITNPVTMTHKDGDLWIGHDAKSLTVRLHEDELLLHCDYWFEDMSPEALTNERKNQHGDWTKQASCAYELKAMIRGYYHVDMTRGQMEALDMIAVKISRILCGDASHEDHWDDIAGYAFLGKGGHKK